MKKRRDGWYQSDKGNIFVVTEKGKDQCRSLQHKAVGAPISEYSTEACAWMIEDGYAEEVPDPDWVIQKGYRVVYDHKGCTMRVGNGTVFPNRILAENYMRHYEKGYYFNHEKLRIEETLYEGHRLEPCSMHEGKPVYNESWYFGTDCLAIGDLVVGEIVDDIINCLPPACMRSDCVQLGEPSSHRKDADGELRATYETFAQVDKNIWRYCGDCFRGENEQYVAEKE